MAKTIPTRPLNPRELELLSAAMIAKDLVVPDSFTTVSFTESFKVYTHEFGTRRMDIVFSAYYGALAFVTFDDGNVLTFSHNFPRRNAALFEHPQVFAEIYEIVMEVFHHDGNDQNVTSESGIRKSTQMQYMLNTLASYIGDLEDRSILSAGLTDITQRTVSLLYLAANIYAKTPVKLFRGMAYQDQIVNLLMQGNDVVAISGKGIDMHSESIREEAFKFVNDKISKGDFEQNEVSLRELKGKSGSACDCPVCTAKRKLAELLELDSDKAEEKTLH